MTKARNIADLGSNDVIETTATGVDVTGTVTADGLTVDGDSAEVKFSETASSSASVVFQEASERLSKIKIDISSPYINTDYYSQGLSGGWAGCHRFFTSDNGSTALKRLSILNNGDVSFYEDTGTTAKFVWDSSQEKLRIGTNVNGGDLQLKHQSFIGFSNSLDTANEKYIYANGGNLEFGTSAQTRLAINSSGNVGIGTASPSAKLEISSGTIKTTPVYSTGNFFKAFHSAPSAGGDGGLYMGAISPNNSDISSGGYYYSGGNYIAKDTTASTINLSNNGIIFRYNSGLTAGNTYASSERARIDSSGNLLVGTTSGTDKVNISQGTGGTILSVHSQGTSGAYAVAFKNPNGTVGNITISGTTTTYNTSSDERLKENIQDTTHTVDINDIKVREFDWKADGSHQRYGFIAQELETVYPEAVHSPEDADEMMSVDYSKLVPLLVKEIQTLKARIETLENK